MVAVKSSSQGIVVRLGDHAFPGPLPKLSLRRPKLAPIAADNQRGLSLLLLFLCFRGAHNRTAR